MQLNSEYALASAVRAARKQAGLSQQQVADLAGMSRVWVARLEGGEANVTLDSLLRVASVLGLSLEATWDPDAVAKAKLPKKRAPKRRAESPSRAGTTSKVKSGTAGSDGGSGKTSTAGKTGTAGKSSAARKASSAAKVSLDDVLSRVTKSG